MVRAAAEHARSAHRRHERALSLRGGGVHEHEEVMHDRGCLDMGVVDEALVAFWVDEHRVGDVRDDVRVGARISHTVAYVGFGFAAALGVYMLWRIMRTPGGL
jgi:hypothetical protein